MSYGRSSHNGQAYPGSAQRNGYGSSSRGPSARQPAGTGYGRSSSRQSQSLSMSHGAPQQYTGSQSASFTPQVSQNGYGHSSQHGSRPSSARSSSSRRGGRERGQFSGAASGAMVGMGQKAPLLSMNGAGHGGMKRDDGEDREDRRMPQSQHKQSQHKQSQHKQSQHKQSHTAMVDNSRGNNFKVVIRVRPPLPRELNGDKPFQNVVAVDEDERVITISENLSASDSGMYSSHVFTFDHVYDQTCKQKKVYDNTAKAVVDSSLSGYNATIFAYGQTGTGKTYTMEGRSGFNSADERGIIPRAIEQIFQHISSSVSPRMRFLVRASYLQIYNEVISDLLKPERSNLVIREDKKKGVFVEGLSEWVVRSPQEIYGLMERGGAMRATGAHKMNELSSRSHAVFIIICEQSETTYVDENGGELSPEEFHKLVKQRGSHGERGLSKLEANVRQAFKVGKLNLVDLAGSERVRLTGATGQRLEESKKINQSLSALGNVIAALTDPRGRQHIPYRDSKLTRILEDSLGGNCKTTMMAMCSPALESFTESLSTLKFANRAKNIKNEARVNEDLDQRSLLRKYERELKRLRAELHTRNRNVVDKRRLLEMDEQRRQAEEDKMAAIRALEARSVEMMREKAEKRKLERRISMLTSQMLIGGVAGVTVKDVQDTPAFRSALKEHQVKIRKQYEAKLAELEKERESIEEEKAQVDRYKQLLLKQRDIMIALTQRLNERDEQIMALQDELDAYDRHQKELEEKLDEKTAALIHLQRVTMEHNASSPVKNNELVKALGDWGANGRQRPSVTPVAMGALTPMASGKSQAMVAAGCVSGVAPSQLLSYKQYPPHSADGGTVVFQTANGSSDSDSSSVGTPPPTLLSADEKIAELQHIVARQQSEHMRAQKELEEVQAEKVSMEYLLRERLEKLVQSEIEARLASYKRDDKDQVPKLQLAKLQSELAERSRELQKLRDAKAKVDEEARLLRSTGGAKVGVRGGLERALEEKSAMLKRLEVENAKLRQAQAAACQSGGGNSQEVAVLQRRVRECEDKLQGMKGKQGGDSREEAQELSLLKDRCNTHEKERRAILTIMEQKIKTLVENVGLAAQSIRGPDSARGSILQIPQGQRLSHELQALKRLVNASIAALKNSSSAAQRQQERRGSHATPGARSQPRSQPRPQAGAASVPLSQRSAQQMSRSHGGAPASAYLSSSAKTNGYGMGNGSNGSSRYSGAHSNGSYQQKQKQKENQMQLQGGRRTIAN